LGGLEGFQEVKEKEFPSVSSQDLTC
jgi:hypothetical protein